MLCCLKCHVHRRQPVGAIYSFTPSCVACVVLSVYPADGVRHFSANKKRNDDDDDKAAECRSFFVNVLHQDEVSAKRRTHKQQINKSFDDARPKNEREREVGTGLSLWIKEWTGFFFLLLLYALCRQSSPFQSVSCVVLAGLGCFFLLLLLCFVRWILCDNVFWNVSRGEYISSGECLPWYYTLYTEIIWQKVRNGLSKI